MSSNTEVSFKSIKDSIKQKDNILRNIILRSCDLHNELLTDEFFKRTDISEDKKEILKSIQNNIVNHSA